MAVSINEYLTFSVNNETDAVLDFDSNAESFVHVVQATTYNENVEI